MVITKSKIAASVVFCVVTVAAMIVLRSLSTPGLGLFMALLFSVMGLTLIWLAEPLGEIACFSRGVPNPSPPAMIQAIGWIFMLGYPVLMACLIVWPPAR